MYICYVKHLLVARLTEHITKIIRFKIVETKITKFTKITNYIMIGLAISLMISIFIWDYDKGSNIIALVTLCLYISFFFIKLFRSFVIKDFVPIGLITFYPDKIEIKQKEVITIYELDKLKEIHVKYYGYDGEHYPYNKSYSLANFNQKEGNGNIIEIIGENAISNKIDIHLENYYQSKLLFRMLKLIESKGVVLVFKNKFGNDNIYKNI